MASQPRPNHAIEWTPGIHGANSPYGNPRLLFRAITSQTINEYDRPRISSRNEWNRRHLWLVHNRLLPRYRSRCCDPRIYVDQAVPRDPQKMKTVALKNPGTGEFTMMQLTGFGSISEDDRSQYATASSLSSVDTRVTTLEDTSVGIVDGGRAALQYTEATDIDGGSASL